MATKASIYGTSFAYTGGDNFECLAGKVEELVRLEISTGAAKPLSLARVSIALGLIEASLTCEASYVATEAPFPELPGEIIEELQTRRFEAELVSTLDKFRVFAEGISLSKKSVQQDIIDIANAVWKAIKSGFSKDALHQQSIYAYLHAKRADCFGLACTVMAICHYLGTEEDGTGLKSVCLWSSEDHCWLGYKNEEGLDSTAEVAWVENKSTKDKKRGLPILKEDEHKWLYMNRHPVQLDMCGCVVAMTQLIAPGVGKGKKFDSDHLQEIQLRLLRMISEEYPALMYPMAWGALGDLEEIVQQVLLERAVGDVDALKAILAMQRPAKAFKQGMINSSKHASDIRDANLVLWEEKSKDEALPTRSHFQEHLVGAPAGYQIYAHTYGACYNGRLAEWLHGQPDLLEQALDAALQSISMFGTSGQVLAKHHFDKDDEQLVKEVEGGLEMVSGLLKWCLSESTLSSEQMLIAVQDCLKWFDGVLVWELRGGREKVVGDYWAKLMVKILAQFTHDLRLQTVNAFENGELVMLRSKLLTVVVQEYYSAPKLNLSGMQMQLTVSEVGAGANSNGRTSRKRGRGS